MKNNDNNDDYDVDAGVADTFSQSSNEDDEEDYDDEEKADDESKWFEFQIACNLFF